MSAHPVYESTYDDALELELQMVVNYHVGAECQAHVPCPPYQILKY